jgi:hypothetical protein
VMEALEVLLAPASVEVDTTLLFLTPPVTPVTFTEIVHEMLAASVPAERLTADAAATAVVVPAQVLLRVGGVESTKPAGKLSVNETPVRLKPKFGFCRVNVNEVAPFSGTLEAPKVLVIVPGIATVRLAVAELPVPPLVEVMLLVVLVKLPDAVPVTVMLNTH